VSIGTVHAQWYSDPGVGRYIHNGILILVSVGTYSGIVILVSVGTYTVV